MSHSVNLKLSRFERQPWGFRLHGGTDFGTPLLIQKVNLSSLSEAAGLQAGDLLLAVNGQDVQNCKHKEAQDTIVRAGNNFEITVQRGGVLNQALRPSSQTPVPQKPIQPPPAGNWTGVLDSNRAGAADNAEEFTKQFMSQLTGETPGNLPPQIIANPQVNGQVHPTQTNNIQNNSRISTPTQQMTTSPTPHNPKMLGQYNSPQSLYSEGNIQEVLSQQAEMLSSGVKGINFNEDKDVDLSNSETLKLVHELDNKGPEPEPGENGISRVNGIHDNGNIMLNNVHNVHAPMISNKDTNGGGGQRFCPSPSPSSTMPRRTESPAPGQRPGSSQSLPRPGSSQATASPAFNRSANFNNQGAPQIQGQSQTQGRISVSSTEDIDYSSNKPKKDDDDILKDNCTRHKIQKFIPLTRGTSPNTGCFASGSDIKEKSKSIAKNLSKFMASVRSADDPSAPPKCQACSVIIERGPFITALGKTWCPNHFVCSMDACRQSLQDVGFVEEKSQLYCEDCYGRYLAPDCEKCRKKIIGNCLKAMGKNFHPECFACAYCGKIFANSPFYLEDGLPYCEEDWNELFTTKCISCGFPIEAGDRWVEALNNNYHSQCFNCTLCKKNLEGQSFFVKAGKPFCKSHARG